MPVTDISVEDNSTTDSQIQSYDPKVAGMVLRKFFCMLEKVNVDNIETERKRQLLKTIKY